MVCPRCIEAVKRVLKDLKLDYTNVSLGKVELTNSPDSEIRKKLAEALQREGFELLEDRNARLVNEIRQFLLDKVYIKPEPVTHNFSALLAEKFNHDYSYLSRLFSTVEGLTIERYIIRLKVEKVKELLTYEEYTLTQIADFLGYSSVSHLSSQFRKETGMTPSDFKALQNPPRSSLDAL